jgi:hypothetical protein
MPVVLVVQAIRKRTLKLAESFVKKGSERNQIKRYWLTSPGDGLDERGGSSLNASVTEWILSYRINRFKFTLTFTEEPKYVVATNKCSENTLHEQQIPELLKVQARCAEIYVFRFSMFTLHTVALSVITPCILSGGYRLLGSRVRN